MIMRSPDYNSTPSEGYWSEYTNSSESSIERHKDPKHNRRTTARVVEESYTRRGGRIRARNARSGIDRSTSIPTNHATKTW
jgi:hypothetical protein